MLAELTIALMTATSYQPFCPFDTHRTSFSEICGIISETQTSKNNHHKI